MLVSGLGEGRKPWGGPRLQAEKSALSLLKKGDVQAALGLERQDGWKQSCHLSQIQGEKNREESLGSRGLTMLEAARAPDSVRSKGWL